VLLLGSDRFLGDAPPGEDAFVAEEAPRQSGRGEARRHQRIEFAPRPQAAGIKSEWRPE